MKTCASIVVFFAVFISLQSQTNTNKSVNMYFCTFLNERGSFYIRTSFKNPESWISHALSFGYQWNHSENLVHEIEMMPLRYCHTRYMDFVFDSLNMSYNDMGYDNQIYNSSVRYSYAYSKGFKNMRLMIGCAARLFYYNHRIKPYAPDEYFRSVTAAGISLEFIPALQYELTGNIHVRFDVPLSMADIHFRREKNENPILESRHQISDNTGLYLLDRLFLFRIGLSCRICNSLE